VKLPPYLVMKSHREPDAQPEKNHHHRRQQKTLTSVNRPAMSASFPSDHGLRLPLESPAA
jgi:hypothetical protein